MVIVNKETKFKRIKIRVEDHAALRIAAAHWGLSLQDAFTKLVYGIQSANDAGLLADLRTRRSAAVSAEGGEGLGR